MLDTADVEVIEEDEACAAPESLVETPQALPGLHIALTDFIRDFGPDLLGAVRRQNPPVYDGQRDPKREAVMDRLLRAPFEAQRERVQAMARLLVDHDAPATVLNAEMGTGKTMMAIALAAVMHQEGYRRALVIAPPHLVYKWRREIKCTVPNARVWVLNGPDTLKKLLALRAVRERPTVPEFYVMGRVRMRMGFNWRPAFVERRTVVRDELGRQVMHFASCPRCGAYVCDEDGEAMSPQRARVELDQHRRACQACGERLWSLHAGRPARPRRAMLLDALQQIPTIGAKTAEKLLAKFGEAALSGMLEDNLFEFINLMDETGDLVFSDRQARRMERAMATTEFAFGQGGYQASEFIKRYLPQGFFSVLVLDEAHEYKNEGSAQGQAMGVLARKCAKTVLLTGTLMGGYASDLFYLLWRLHPAMMIEDGFTYNSRGSLGGAEMAFMREHGVLKDIFKDSDERSHRTAKAKAVSHRTAKGAGFGPKGVMRYVLPITVFLKLKEIGGDVLPPYRESFVEVAMTDAQEQAYGALSETLTTELRQGLARGDTTLLGVVLNVLLAWPDCAFRDELVRHPRTRGTLAFVPRIFGEDEAMPKEIELIGQCKRARSRGRRALVYCTYTGTRDTTSRLKVLLEREGLRVAVLRASVEASKREDWLLDQVERGVQVVITNPELVKTGLDMLEFPSIVFMQSGFNTYTLQQASRRSWRIGQQQDVEVVYLGYGQSAQMSCLALMAQKIAVSQSTSGDMPDCGLDVLNQSGDSIEVALARQLLA